MVTIKWEVSVDHGEVVTDYDQLNTTKEDFEQMTNEQKDECIQYYLDGLDEAFIMLDSFKID